MNKSFKVVFNKARGALMVVNEVTSSVQAKGTKTVIAAAVTSVLMTGPTMAETSQGVTNEVTYDSVVQKEDTFKFNSAKGQKTIIKTEASANKFVADIKQFADSKSLTDLMNALTQPDEDKKTGILLGYAGGHNIMDIGADATLDQAGNLVGQIKKISNQFTTLDEIGQQENTSSVTFDKGTYLITQKREEGANGPLMIGTVVGDRVVNSGINLDLKKPFEKPIHIESPKDVEVIRTGDAIFEHQAGNVFGLITGSSAINFGFNSSLEVNIPIILPAINASTNASSTKVTLNGSTKFEASNDACSAGVINGGSAIALGGKANSTVTGDSVIHINNTKENEAHGNLNTLHVGLVGGGLALSTLGGESIAEVQGNTDINLESGLVGGVIGGGVAISASAADLKQIFGSTQESEGKNKEPIKLEFDKSALDMPGHATAESKNVTIKVGPKVTAGLLVGGGLAAHYQFGDAKKPEGENTPNPGAVSNVDDVNIVLGGDTVSTGKVDVDKSKLFGTIKDFVSGVGASISGDDIDFGKLQDATMNFVYDIDDHDGVTVGVLGGGVAVGYDRNRYGNNGEFTANAKAEVVNSTITVNSGYNVALVGGGLAAGSGHSLKGDQILAESNVSESVNMTFNGGETVGVMGGGTAIWAGSAEAHTGIGAKASVKQVNLFVNGGSVDGLFGGGFAIDDSNPKVNDDFVAANNALSQVNTVNIQVGKGKVGKLAVEAFEDIKNVPGAGLQKPETIHYLKSVLYGIQENDVAIMGGGFSSGNRAEAVKDEIFGSEVGTANIYLGKDAVIGETTAGYQGNVFGGGIATEGGFSHVGTANIVLDGATVNGSIYGGGIAVGGEYSQPGVYNNALSQVDEVLITLNSGTINGDVHAGGVSMIGDLAKSVVGKATIQLTDKVEFNGSTIDGSGADTATLEIYGDVDLAKKTETAGLLKAPTNVIIGGFDNINGEHGSLKNADFAFGDKKNTTITGGQFDFVSVKDGQGKTMTLDKNAAVAITGTAANNFVVTNGVLGLGSDAAAKDAADAKGNYPGDAALYLSGTVNLKDKTITVGKTEQKGVAIGKNGMLIVDAGLEKGETANQTVATKVDGAITDDGGKLHYVNVAEQGLVQIAGTDKMEATVDNVLFEIVNTQDSEGNAAIGFAVVKDQGKLDNLGVGDFNTGALQQIAGQKDEASEFINGFMNGQAGVALSGADRNAKLKSAFNLGAAAGVQTAGIDSALMGIDEATKRASLTNVFNDGWTGFASVTGNQLKFGDSSDALETKTKLAGVAVGGEYTMGDMTFGALGHFGSGDVKGQGRNSGVKNDVDYYGFQAYAAKRINQFNVVGQLGYVMTKNDITHDVGQSTKVDADVFTMGVRGEMNYAINDTWNAVPYVGLNWLRVSTDAYTTNKGIRVDSTDQDLINMPIGVAISGDCSNVAGWTVRPVVDVAYVHTFGDTDLDATSHVGEAAMGTTLDVWSENVGRFSVGAEARNGNMGFGFKLGGAKGDGGHEEFFGQLNAKYVF